MPRQPSAVPPAPLKTPRDVSQEINLGVAQDLKKSWGGRFPSWQEFKAANKSGRVRTNKNVGIKAIHFKGIPRGFWLLFGIVTPCGMFAAPIVCIILASFGVWAWWTIILGLCASWFLYKVSLEGAADAIRHGAEANEALYQALVPSGAFMFSPESPSPHPQTSNADLIGALGELMERYPTALLDAARLPAPKQKMKTVIKEVWQQEPKLRGVLTQAYLHLSQFQDGIGDAILDCKLTDEMSPAEMLGPKGENFRQWTAWSKVSMAEMEILVQEWEQFERSNGPAPLPTHALRERAQRLVPSANIHATSLFVPMLDQFPLLRNVKPDQWDFVVTIASVFIAATRLRNLKKEDTLEEKLMEIVALGLAEWDQNNGVRGFEDCKAMYERTYDALTNHADPRFIASYALGWWTVWNLLGREPKGEEEQRLVHTIGGATVHAFFLGGKARRVATFRKVFLSTPADDFEATSMTEKDSKQQADGSASIFLHPPDLLQFVSTEHQHFLTSLVTCHEEIKILSHVHGLYAAAMTNQTTDVSTVVIFQLLAFVHYHFLFASSSYMRCHMAEGFSSARAAIDGALIASQIIHDRASQVAYIERSKPFDKLIRHFKNRIRDKKPLPHPLVEHLIQQHDFCSQFASHADVQTFAHRVEFLSQPQEMMSMGYFQFPREPPTMKHHFLGLLHVFVVTLDIFAAFLVDEKKWLPEAWRQELHHVGHQIETRQKQLLPDGV